MAMAVPCLLELLVEFFAFAPASVGAFACIDSCIPVGYILAMTAKLNSLALFTLAAVALIIAGILGATSHAVPTQLWTVIYVLIGGAAGVTFPQAVATTTPTPTAVPTLVNVPGVPVGTTAAG